MQYYKHSTLTVLLKSHKQNQTKCIGRLNCKIQFWKLDPNIWIYNLISLINLGPTLPDFEKFQPPQKKSTLHVYWFLRFFPPSTPRLLELCISFFHKIPPSTFIPTSTFGDLANFAPPPRLFQPPCLFERWD